MKDSPHVRPAEVHGGAESSRSPSRRALLSAAAAATAAPLLSAVDADATTRQPNDLLYVGTWGQGQVYAVWFDPGRGTMTPIGPVAEVASNWVVTHPNRPVLYVAGSEQGGLIRTFHIDGTTGALRLVGTLTTEPAPTGSGGLSYIGATSDADTPLVADFADGSASTVPIRAAGGLGTVASRIQDSGSGPNERQQGPHVHHIVIDPDHRFALVADFGADRVFVHAYDRDSRGLSAGFHSFSTAPGSGPRRLAFHPAGRTVYLLNELTADIQVLGWEAVHGTLSPRQTLSTNAPDHTGATSAAELSISQDGRHVYVSNRGGNAVVVYATDPVTHLLTEVQRVPCAGVTPWSMSLHPGGRWLFVANKGSGTVNLFRVDRSSGHLTNTGRSVAVPAADCVAVRAARM
ncbi:lactonase family protein [Streptomyces sp. BH106]|uniref:lactonase family protein n=1 Tax=Streptomyces sp. BH106 TaxID=3410409 RepID=UPI003CEA9A94